MQYQRLIPLLVVFLVLAVFWQVRYHEFVWDDRNNITENPYLKHANLSSILTLWQEPYQNLYVPLTYTVWGALAGVAGRSGGKLDPRPFHTANLILHVLNVLLVYVILRRLVRKDWAAGGGALLFALHPVQVETVAWVTGMKDLLSGFLSLVAVWQYLLYAAPGSAATGGLTKGKSSVAEKRISRRRGVHYVLATLAFALALLAKPAAVAVPLVVWVMDCWVLKRPFRQSVTALGGWVGIALPFIGLTKWVQPDEAIDFITPLWARPLLVGDTLAFYMYKLVVPFWLGPDYGRSPEVVLNQGWLFITWLIPFGLGVWLWYWRDRGPWLIAAAGVFVCGVLPVSGLVPFSFQNISTVADRYLYLSMLGPAMALGWFLSQSRGNLIPAVCGVLLLSLALASTLQASTWKNNLTLFQHALQLNPKSWIANYNVGVDLAEQKRLDDAISYYRTAISIRPRYADAHSNLGSALSVQGKLEEAIDHYRRALQVQPMAPDVHYNLGNIFARQQRWEAAVEHYKKSLQTEPNNIDTLASLGHVLFRQGRLDEAVVNYRQILAIDPEVADVHYSLGNILAQRGEFDEALNHYRQAVRINPTYAGAHYNLGIIFASRGQLDLAIDHFYRALRIRPQFAEAHESLARALTLRGNRNEAIKHYQEALRILSSGRETSTAR